jgi:hypothetical protein
MSDEIETRVKRLHVLLLLEQCARRQEENVIVVGGGLPKSCLLKQIDGLKKLQYD